MIAIYGGTFDPIHVGHVHVARWVLKHLRPRKLVFVPTSQNPHKTAPTPSRHRLKMVELAVEQMADTRLEVSRIEIDSDGPSYTVNTLTHFSLLHSNLLLVTGSDTMRSFSKWKSPERILELANILIVRRDAFDLTLLSQNHRLPAPTENTITWGNDRWIRLMDIGAIEISATSLRHDIAQFFRGNIAKTAPQGVQQSVWQYIKENRLYTDWQDR